MTYPIAIGVVVWNQGNDRPEWSRVQTSEKYLIVRAGLNVGTWLECEYNPRTSTCTRVKPIEPPIHTRYFHEPGNLSEFHLVFYGQLERKGKYDYRYKYLGKVGISAELGKNVSPTVYVEFEYKKSVGKLSAITYFDNVSDEVRLRLPVERSFYRDVDGTIDRQYMADAYNALKAADVRVIDEEDVKVQTKSIKLEVKKEEIPPEVPKQKPKLRNLFNSAGETTRLFEGIRPRNS
ncbi:hypothetical protein M3Y97_00911800 [Aphelenchoides bicaudatus]|nr:hypothetical protein M3Y97_00911800 [Aphelenchoides bicaudatus]